MRTDVLPEGLKCSRVSKYEVLRQMIIAHVSERPGKAESYPEAASYTPYLLASFRFRKIPITTINISIVTINAAQDNRRRCIASCWL